MLAPQSYKSTREDRIRILLLEAADAECSSSETAPPQDISNLAAPAAARTPGATRAGPGQHVFDLAKVNHILGGPDYSTANGACVEGERMIVALMRMPAGTGAQPHSHPNEQWIYVLEGTFRGAGPSYAGRYRRGIGPLLRPPCCVCSQACARMPIERDTQKRPRARGAGKPSSA